MKLNVFEKSAIVVALGVAAIVTMAQTPINPPRVFSGPVSITGSGTTSALTIGAGQTDPSRIFYRAADTLGLIGAGDGTSYTVSVMADNGANLRRVDLVASSTRAAVISNWASGSIPLNVGGGGEQWQFTSTGNFVSLTPFGHIRTSAPNTQTGASYSVVDADNYIIANRAGTVTLTLPTASSYTGRAIYVKTITANTVVSAGSDVIPRAGGAAGTAILAATAGNWGMLVSNGTAWELMAGTP